jgi:uncharacterized protein YuzE
MLMLDISIDREFNLAYVRTGAGTFGRTIMVNDDINVDLDVNEGIIGVEFLYFGNLTLTRESLMSNELVQGPGIIAAILEAQEILVKKLSSASH